MITDAVRAEYEHRFAMYDTDGDGYLTAQDFTDRARLLTDAVGEPADSPKARALGAGMRHTFEQLATLAQVDATGRLNREQFVAAFVRAGASGSLGQVVGPSIAATVALADADGDGVVSREDFAVVHRAAGYSAAQAAEAFAALDRDGDGRLLVEAWPAE
ncbi:EF-hand domain-containing protein [Streptomyces lydicamycinicus]|uniref:EF-hand domain-containing protein n=1 Tax=Streptomyces lydicamycinicus TaxID=1546107 RepID=UPI002035F720|nr:EF-hand domain-containing protein [Streptomyces lydicamycinicus]URZ99826.1 EF-hand domain-containing protein [Streptomyces lydicamycinicus]